MYSGSAGPVNRVTVRFEACTASCRRAIAPEKPGKSSLASANNS